MIRIAKPSDPQKIQELKKKIYQESYLEVAILGIATILTGGLLEWNGVELVDDESVPTTKKKKQL
ncbi:hypothetical protein [Entomospira culicis]|uniref:Uncharacterized protein n=1 Tax=Entomospira culicis TaxID=2719989 RepID=A0A968GFA4_9SPIO|nr:hypothetical protein [Entomospira culicis]NIZ19007.1 hypothetical protein [Entomospira culicis]NIZ69222.1 hypothetical protein [Entomospira culicis]WDI37807.1 hypothetical protein PVA46_03205 [Entomospira culicis]WDI39435.1 hypothetical protein PVA47_03210 [Entomospira culicis]